MFLLSDDQVLRQMSQRRLRITPFREDRLYSTCYYFSLGRTVKIRDAKGPITRDLAEGPVVLETGDLVTVQSEEYFALPPDVLMLVGQQTAMPVERGLQLLHGPTVDPSYEGHLDMAILNVSPLPTALELNMGIGRASFFNVADTNLPPDHRIVGVKERLERIVAAGGQAIAAQSPGPRPPVQPT